MWGGYVGIQRTVSLWMTIYIYIYVCVCVCVYR